MNEFAERSEELKKAAQKILDASQKEGIDIRLLGGMGVYMTTPCTHDSPYARRIEDLDFVVSSRQGFKFSKLLEKIGFPGDHEFNSIHGASRMLFSSELTDIDVFVEEFEQCHKINLTQYFKSTKQVIPMAVLLLTKLQIVEINQKDIMDILAILHDHSFAADGQDEEIINSSILIDVLGNDWGWYTTVTDNVRKIQKALPDLVDNDDQKLLDARLNEFMTIAEKAPKSLKWKVRSRIGRSVTWYELPEEKKI